MNTAALGSEEKLETQLESGGGEAPLSALCSLLKFLLPHLRPSLALKQLQLIALRILPPISNPCSQHIWLLKPKIRFGFFFFPPDQPAEPRQQTLLPGREAPGQDPQPPATAAHPLGGLGNVAPARSRRERRKQPPALAAVPSPPRRFSIPASPGLARPGRARRSLTALFPHEGKPRPAAARLRALSRRPGGY